METDFDLNSRLKKVFKNERNHSCVFILCLRSDCSMMSSSDIELVTSRDRQQRQPQILPMNLHLLANPGDSLLLQHSLDRLLRWLCPSLRIFHVSERASPFRSYTHLCPVAGYPSVAITFFLHEAYGEERILKVLDFFQHPPWQYHHTETCGSQTGGIHISSNSSSSNAMHCMPCMPYLLPSRDFYSLGAGMPVWGVRPVHCGGEILRVTLYSGYDNYEDAVRLYETVLQRQAEEQKTGFCWFTLHTEPGLCMQLALKQLSPGVQVEPCSSAVLQFSVEEIGQLVPLLPNPCTPISGSRWQTEDLDGNKVLFQVKTPAQPQRPLTCAFPLTCPSVPPRAVQLRSPAQGPSLSPCSLTTPRHTHRQGLRPRSDPALEKLYGGGVAESQGSGSCCSTPPGSSCYSSQRSSPAPPSTPHHPDSPLRSSITHHPDSPLCPSITHHPNSPLRPSTPHHPNSPLRPSITHHPDSPLRPSITLSLSHLLLEEDEEEPETNVDTGVSLLSDSAVKILTRSSSVELLMTPHPERPAAVGASAVHGLAKELIECLPRTHKHPQVSSGTWGSAGCTHAARKACSSRTVTARQSPPRGPFIESRTTAELLSAHTHKTDDEFFI
ncbi:protein FAM124B isoform X2 [Gymnodraco acuticeps]|uniref:Protein FAM124B isoform X2 n=1 Tax=Gymnodraco acuticeps TaxID=8218 RepID=A0A6P8VQ46_GYMAC|nr:protein FAM124B isoform X2 [Gymnodraco acuticeps]